MTFHLLEPPVDPAPHFSQSPPGTLSTIPTHHMWRLSCCDIHAQENAISLDSYETESLLDLRCKFGGGIGAAKCTREGPASACLSQLLMVHPLRGHHVGRCHPMARRVEGIEQTLTPSAQDWEVAVLTFRPDSQAIRPRRSDPLVLLTSS